MVADFDPYQAGDLTADPDIKTMQFVHKGKGGIKDFFKLGWLANETEKGDVETPKSKSDSPAHAMASFIADISQLSEGTYKWDDKDQKFVKVK